MRTVVAATPPTNAAPPGNYRSSSDGNTSLPVPPLTMSIAATPSLIKALPASTSEPENVLASDVESGVTGREGVDAKEDRQACRCGILVFEAV
jgi:hypothetical protein